MPEPTVHTEVDDIEDPRRVEAPLVGVERDILEAWLEYHRATLLLKVEGASDADRRARPVPTSLLSLHGLVRHMAEVERTWFPRVIDGQPLTGGLYWSEAHPDGDFELIGDADWDADLAEWHAQCAVAREVAARHDLDDVGIRRSSSRTTEVSLRWVYVHMIEEYARHNGHADLIRELVDGTVGG